MTDGETSYDGVSEAEVTVDSMRMTCLSEEEIRLFHPADTDPEQEAVTYECDSCGREAILLLNP